MKIAVVGTGYVGLVTGVALSHIGHDVTCVDIDEKKVERMRKGISPIYEPGLEELMLQNIEENRLFFTTSHQEGFENAQVVYIAVGTPEREDGSANLSYIEQVAKDIAQNVKHEIIVVTKSTVPVGTNHYIKQIIAENLNKNIKVEVVSNPEFLREGSSVYDTFNGDRIVVGSDSVEAANVIEEINKPFGIPVYKTDIRSAEMIKYASNAFLATKISFINEIANICEKAGANIEDVAQGMGLDQRIGSMFLKAGIGYGGSCFPKDTKALTKIASNVDLDFTLLKAVVEVNNKQQHKLVKAAQSKLGSLQDKKVAVLGLAFKPNTDDMREAASVVIIKELLGEGAEVTAYDPVAIENAKKLLPGTVEFTKELQEALLDKDLVFIVTEWQEVKELDLSLFAKLMKNPIVFDGRNCFDLKEVSKYEIDYYSIGRSNVQNIGQLV
ncbi:UDP-glucose 6-dehydrogenase ywqF [Bacillus mycoides]|uniref:UDP-glucose dehydrogenase family protein n=1 Tax=Bacillus mycoides TaxID=1405 RepID=UPI0001A05576|nr:UDP-glucose/GDP-mannose dehydrogenase family protein [Bacillus mycoides]AIW87959.1 UDP-glucose 6-dehydrogenase ywqF [Bacillus mycoides]EEL02880.1 UDP-glucose 6-dehydrogenase [Bacillus cereus BDRD-ST196]GAE43041.1 UDP-glucose 6-dehydrogenase [Bacillus mycoides NBRC 101238 = DSM 11821]